MSQTKSNMIVGDSERIGRREFVASAAATAAVVMTQKSTNAQTDDSDE